MSACLSLPCKSKGPVSRGQDMELHKSYLTVISSFQPYKVRHSAMIGREVTIKVTGAGDWSALRSRRQRVNSASVPESKSTNKTERFKKPNLGKASWAEDLELNKKRVMLPFLTVNKNVYSIRKTKSSLRWYLGGAATCIMRSSSCTSSR